MKKILTLFPFLFFLTSCPKEAPDFCTMQPAPIKLKVCVPPNQVTLAQVAVRIYNGAVLRGLVISFEGGSSEKNIGEVADIHDFDFDHPDKPETSAPLEYSLLQLFPNQLNLLQRPEVRLDVKAEGLDGKVTRVVTTVNLK